MLPRCLQSKYVIYEVVSDNWSLSESHNQKTTTAHKIIYDQYFITPIIRFSTAIHPFNNRPGVAGAVLQTPLLLIVSVSQSVIIFLQTLKTSLHTNRKS